MAEIRLVNIVKRFGMLEAVKDLNLTIEDREFLVLLGPSGCGKTTTLRAIAGLETVDEGEIWIDGRLVNDMRPSNRDIAFVFQLYALYPHLNVYRNIAFPLETQGAAKKEVNRRVTEVSRILKIEHILKKRPGSLSGGDMQRVALGRAMVRRPKAFLMDEPIGTLDAKFREVMRTELKRLHIDIGATTVYVTHDQVEAMSMGDRIAVMSKGLLQQVGKPDEVYDNPVNLFVANFIGSPGMNFLDVELVTGTAGAIGATGAPGAGRGKGAVENRGAASYAKAVLSSDEKIGFSFSKDLSRKLAGQHAFGKKLVLGIRPECIGIESKKSGGGVPAEVYVVEPLGSSKIVTLTVGNDHVKARTPVDFEARIGDRVWATFAERKAHFFDKRTGDAVALA